MSSPYLTEADVRRLLDPRELCAAIESAFRDRYPSISLPPRTHVELAHGIFLAMSCYDGSTYDRSTSDGSTHNSSTSDGSSYKSPTGTLGMKLILLRDQNHHPVASHSPRPADEASLTTGRVQATYLLLDPETAQPRLTIAANYLTDLRTAATSAVATKFLARPDASTLGIFGTGRLARAHLDVLPLARNFQRVLICGRNSSRSAEFVGKVSAEFPNLAISVVDARTGAAESDVLCTCTSHTAPLFDGRDLRPGTHLNLVGAFRPETREVDTVTIQRARVVVETYNSARSDVGEFLIPWQEGAIPRDHLAADLHELVSGTRQGRRSPEEITVFKSVGCALEDMVAAELLLNRL
jgi:ornithine cyclodeaminase/alanine dehydrogenase-like protein (mu-crystallin family)